MGMHAAEMTAVPSVTVVVPPQAALPSAESPSSSPFCAPPSRDGVSYINDRRVLRQYCRPPTGTRGKDRVKPKWALTAQEEEAELDAEARALIEFTEELDYDQWVDDLEDQEHKRAEEERVARQKEAEQQAQDEAIAHTLPAHREDETVQAIDEGEERDIGELSALVSTLVRPLTQQQQPTPQRPLTGSRPASSPSTSSPQPAPSAGPSLPTSALVSSLLHSHPQLRSIHSSQSLRALITSEQSHSSPLDSFIPSINTVSVAIPEPCISVIKERAACNAEINPSYLPYLHRCPSV